MSLDYAILGFLNYGASSGYDLKKAFDASIKHFWSANQSQIYRTLSRLSEDGWVAMDVVEQDDRPDRKVYHITEAGKAALRDWLLTPLPLEMEHSATLIQIFFSAQLNNTAILAALQQQAEILRARLAQLDAIPKQATTYMQQINSSRDVFFWTLTLDYGLQLNRAKLAWVEATMRKIEEISPNDSQ